MATEIFWKYVAPQSPAGPSDVTGTLYNQAQTRRVIRTLLDSYTWTHSRFWTGTLYLDTGPISDPFLRTIVIPGGWLQGGLVTLR